MSYSAKIGDINGFDLDIIAMGSRRRAKAESERKALVNSEKYSEPGPRILNGGMDTNDKLKVVAAAQIEKMYSAPAIKTRQRPSAPAKPQQRPVEKRTVEYAAHTRQIPVKVQPATKEIKAASAQPNPQPRQRNPRTYTAKPRFPAQIQTRKDKNKNPAPLGAISAIIIITALMLYFIVLYIQSFELKDSITNMKSELSDKMMTQSTWETRLDEKNPSLDKIEEFATNDGMIRKTPDKYISITPDEDIIEIYDNE